MLQNRKKLGVGSIDFTPATFTEATQAIAQVILKTHNASKGTGIHFANAYNIALAENNRSYRNTMNAGDLVFTDGVPVVWAASMLHPQHKWERVYGPDTTEWILSNVELNETAKHYFLGSTPDTMNRLINQIAKKFPTVRVVGRDCPPFREPSVQELNERDQRIKESGATVVWVGLGTPKQDFEVQRLANSLSVTAMAVGAAFDFIAETVPQAPKFIQKSGLEWSYRLAKEPKRLAKRYFWGNPQFIKSTLTHKSSRSR